MLKKSVLSIFIASLLLFSATVMAKSTTMPRSFPRIVAAAYIDYANGAYFVSKDAYNIKLVSSTAPGIVYVTFEEPLPTNTPIVFVASNIATLSTTNLTAYHFVSTSSIGVNIMTRAGTYLNAPFSIIVYANL